MMKRLNLITFVSAFQKQEEAVVRETHAELFASLDASYDVHVYFSGMLSQMQADEWNTGTTVLFIATGGTEGLVVRCYDMLPRPTVLLTDGKANSLAASLELACWIRQQGDGCRIIHGSMEQVVAELADVLCGCSRELRGHGVMKGTRIGVLGTPSDWLVSSHVDYAAALQQWGVEYVDVPLELVERYYDEDAADVEEEAETFVTRARGAWSLPMQMYATPCASIMP